MSKEDLKDIVPEILSNIKKEFDSGIKSNKNISNALEILSQNKADFKNANDVSIEVGQVLAYVYKNNISAGILPDGRMYYNIADRLITNPMEKAHSFIADYAENVQANLNAEANLGIRAIRPELNRDRIKGLVEKASNAEGFEEVAWLLDEPIKNFCQSIIDDTIKANAEFQYKLGLKPVIIRKEAGNCCDWCKQLAGTYDYPNVPDEVYKRHRYCRCTVEYYPADGKKAQNIHTKRWQDVDRNAKIEERKSINSKTLKIDSKQFAKKAKTHMKDYDLNVTLEEDRKKFEMIIIDIYENHDKVIRGIEWRGQKDRVVAFIKGVDVVLVNQNNEFITIMKGGINNERIKNKRK